MVQCPFVAVRCFAADYFLFYLDADFVNIAYRLFLDLALDYLLASLTLDRHPGLPDPRLGADYHLYYLVSLVPVLDVLLIDYIRYCLNLLGSLGAWYRWPKLFLGLPLQVPLADGGR